MAAMVGGLREKRAIGHYVSLLEARFDPECLANEAEQTPISQWTRVPATWRLWPLENVKHSPTDSMVKGFNLLRADHRLKHCLAIAKYVYPSFLSPE